MMAWLHRFAIILTMILVWLLTFPAAMPARAAETLQAYRIYFHSQDDLQRIAAEVDVWTVNRAEGYLVAPLMPGQRTALQATHRVEAMPLPGPFPQPLAQPAQQPAGIPGFACYRTVEETAATLAQLVQTYPRLARLQPIGVSWDRHYYGAPAGHDLEVLVLTNRDRPGPKFRFFLMGAIHARELVTAETALRFAESLLTGYGTDPDATWLLDHGELHVIPISNPDGRQLAETGVLWRKNTNREDAACALPLPNFSYGVDLNRNSSFQWNSCLGCSSDIACSMVYRGTQPASEPETQALESYMRSIFADMRGDNLLAAAPITTSGLMISLHSYGEYVLFPWGWSSDTAPNAVGLQTLARKLGFYLDYWACQAGSTECFYQTDGTTDDWAYGELGIPGYTIEMGGWFFEPCDTFETTIVDDALAALRYAFKVAHAPYLWPAGPEVIAVSPLSATVAAGDAVTVTAQADDTRSFSGFFGSDPAQPVQAARASLDQPPWSSEAIHWPVLPADGRFDEPQEALLLDMQTACWSAGRHLLYLQAQDQAGNWGAPSATLLQITDGAEFTIDLDAPSAVEPGTPATYTITITNTSSVEDSYVISAEAASWTFNLPDDPIGPLMPGEAAQVSFTAFAPPGQPEQVRIVVTSTAPSGHCLDIYLDGAPSRRYHFPFLPAQGETP